MQREDYFSPQCYVDSLVQILNEMLTYILNYFYTTGYNYKYAHIFLKFRNPQTIITKHN